MTCIDVTLMLIAAAPLIRAPLTATFVPLSPDPGSIEELKALTPSSSYRSVPNRLLSSPFNSAADVA